MYAVMRDTEYMQKDKFKENFWSDWRKLLGRNHVIQNLKDCDFTPIYDWCQSEKEKKKQMTTEVSLQFSIHFIRQNKGEVSSVEKKGMDCEVGRLKLSGTFWEDCLCIYFLPSYKDLFTVSISPGADALIIMSQGKKSVLIKFRNIMYLL